MRRSTVSAIAFDEPQSEDGGHPECVVVKYSFLCLVNRRLYLTGQTTLKLAPARLQGEARKFTLSSGQDLRDGTQESVSRLSQS